MAQNPVRNQDMDPSNNQSGSIFIWIFIMIALFGALSFAVVQSMRGSSAAIGKDKARIAATEIIAAANQVRDGVRTLKIGGCTDTQISFQNSVTSVTSYNNPLSNDACKLFTSAGGGLKVPVPPKESQVKSKLTGANFWLTPHYTYNAVNKFYQDDGKSELVMWLAHVQPEVCDAINNLLGVGSKTTTGDFDMNENQPFTGAYQTWGMAYLNGSGDADLSGKMMACANYNGGYTLENGRLFYAILLKR